MFSLRSNGHRKGTAVTLNDPNDDTKDSERTGKDLHYQNLHKEGRVLGVGQGAGAPSNSDRNTASDVGQTHAEARGEHPVSCVIHEVIIPAVGKLHQVNFQRG